MFLIPPGDLSTPELERELLHPVRIVSPCASGRPLRTVRVQRQLDVARELLLRRLKPQLRGESALNTPQKLCEWLKLHCAGLEYEVFLVLYLNLRGQLIDVERMFRGGLRSTQVSTREIVKAALAHNAAAVFVAHNHPGGDALPSSADHSLTITLEAALNACDIRLLDHFLIAGDRIVSFAEQHWL